MFVINKDGSDWM